MVSKRGKETLLELCTSATTLGNSVSVRLLEYLSTAKNHPHGFREMAIEFLEVCRILWPIQVGLDEAARSHTQFPSDMVSELDKRFRQAKDDFVVLNQMVVKFLDNEKKNGFGKLSKGWRMMFADTDIAKMREALAKSREALRMSALVFRWTLGDEKVEASAGIGYAGLAAVLDHMNHSKGGMTTIQPLATSVPDAPPMLPPLPPAPLLERQPSTNLSTHREELPRLLSDMSDRESLARAAPSTMSSRKTTSSYSRAFSTESSQLDTVRPDNISEITSMTQIDDLMQEYGLNDKMPTQAVRVKADPTSVPRWTPKQFSGANSNASKIALVNAVQQKKHQMVEQLLDCGVPADNGLELNLLRTAIVNRDIETVRLLLLFNADANATDKDGLTPLYTATELSFMDAAKLLLKYGADPNLSAGPEGESPLSISLTDGRMPFAHLFLKYGADSEIIMANGNTAFIKAMNRTTPKAVVDLMLLYGADPNVKNGEGHTALFDAINAKRLDLVTTLLDQGANPNLPGPKHMLWPAVHHPKMLQLLLSRGADYKKCPGILELATSINSLEAVTILLKHGVDPNAKKDGIYTPLCSAIRDDRSQLVTLLLANGADPNLMASEYPAFKCVTHHRVHFLPQVVAAGANLNSPKGIIEMAVAHSNKEALLYLLGQEVNPNDRTPNGQTALTTAIRDGNIEFIDILLANGANPSVRGQDWPICMAVKRPEILRKLLPHISNPRAVKGVLEMAVVANQLESIKLLLAAGVSVEDRNGGVFSPLTTSIREDRKEIFRYLVDEAGADVNAPGEHLPIIKAIRRHRENDTSYIEHLLNSGADINLMHRGWNAVLQAMDNGDSKILRLLAEHGTVDLNAQDESGRTVVDIMNERGSDDELKILLGSRAATRPVTAAA